MAPTIQEVKSKHADKLLAMPGVVSVGIGKNAGGMPTIIVGLDKKRPQTESKILHTLEGEGHPVMVQIIGRLEVQEEGGQ